MNDDAQEEILDLSYMPRKYKRLKKSRDIGIHQRTVKNYNIIYQIDIKIKKVYILFQEKLFKTYLIHKNLIKRRKSNFKSNIKSNLSTNMRNLWKIKSKLFMQ